MILTGLAPFGSDVPLHNITVPKQQKGEAQDEHYGLLSEGWRLLGQSSCLQMAPVPSPKLRSYGCPRQLSALLCAGIYFSFLGCNVCIVIAAFLKVVVAIK